MLQLAPLPPALETQLQREFDVHPLWREAAPQDFLAAHGSEFGLLLTHATAGADAALMDRLPQLRAICSLGVGCDALDLAAARTRGIVVSNTPDVLNDCVADLAVGLMIDVARGMSRADRVVRRGDWPRTGPGALGTRVSGRRVGLRHRRSHTRLPLQHPRRVDQVSAWLGDADRGRHAHGDDT